MFITQVHINRTLYPIYGSDQQPEHIQICGAYVHFSLHNLRAVQFPRTGNELLTFKSMFLRMV